MEESFSIRSILDAVESLLKETPKPKEQVNKIVTAQSSDVPPVVERLISSAEAYLSKKKI